jgi:lipase chaperone LimK
VKRSAPYTAAVALLAAAALFLARSRPPRRHPSVTPAAPAPAAAPALAPVAVPPPESATTGPLSPALRDTEVDGELGTDARGDLVVTPDVRRFFDYFLVASTDVSPEAMRERIAAEIRKRLPGKATAEATDLLDRYLEYRRRAAALDADGGNDYEARLSALWALRREVIGTRDAAALFGDDEESVRAALERQRIQTDPRLSDDEKAQALADAEARLPDAERKARADATSALQLWNDEQAARARGASDAEIRALRVERVGPEAADRLDQLDGQRAAFQSAMDQARAQQDALVANDALSDEERTAALRQWIAAHFPPEEQTHAGVLLGLPAN